MGIKSRLFGKPWQHRDAQIRARAVADSTDPELLEQLPRLASEDESAAVRLAALQRLDEEALWLEAHGHEQDAAIRAAADAFLTRSLMQAAPPPLLAGRLRWLESRKDAAYLRQIASEAPELPLRQAALARIDSPGFLGDRVVAESDEALALSLVERIDQESTLERIAETLRRSSKTRALAVSQRLEALQIQRGKVDPVARKAGELVEQAEALALGRFDGSHSEELARLRQEWQALDAPAVALARRFEGALGLVERAREVAARPEAEPALEAAAETPAASAELSALVDRLTGDPATLEQLPQQQVVELLAEYDRLSQAADRQDAQTQVLHERALPGLRLLQKQRQQRLERKTAAPATSEVLPADRTAEAAVNWTADMDAAAALLEKGEAIAAHKALRQLHEQLRALPARQRPAAVSGRMSRLDGRLREMRQWEHWSNNQRRDELIARVEQLAGSDQHPDAISAVLKEARAEWQRLEKLEIFLGDRRRFAAPAGQWRRFQDACKAAFDEARPHFEKRRETQDETLSQLQRFIAQGQTLASRPDAEIKEVLGHQRSARKAIRRLDELSPRARGKAAADLRSLMEALSARLDELFGEIELGKRRLIREAEALADESDLKAAAERAKALQQSWQKLGSGRRQVDQALWKAFRTPLDSIFEQLDAQRKERSEEHQARLEEVRALLDQAQALVAEQPQPVEERMRQLRVLRGQLAGIETRGQGRSQARFNELEDQLQDELNAAHAEQRRARRARLREQADLLQQLWTQRLGGQEVSAPESGGEDVTEEPAATLQARVEQFADPDQTLEALSTQVEKNGATARQLLIEMEFLAGVDSPEEERQARMDFQVQRLAQRMSERSQAPSAQAERQRLLQAWYASHPHPPELHEALALRFESCQNALDLISES